MTHPLADALCAVADELFAMAPSTTFGQAVWSYEGKAMVTARFSKAANTTAHQDLTYARGLARIKDLLHAITGPMEDVPALAGAPFHWRFSITHIAKRPAVQIAYADQAIVTGSRQAVAKVLATLIPVLADLPAHSGQIFAWGPTRLPAADAQSAVLLWTALCKKGIITPQTLDSVLGDMQSHALSHIVPIDLTFETTLHAKIAP